MGRSSDAKPRLMCAALELCWSASYSSATIDDLCAKADVRKGSFYHFFRSKSDLVAAALGHWLAAKRPEMDHIFSVSQSGEERLEAYLDWIVQGQLKGYENTGKVLGCPLFTLGCEVSHLDPFVCEKVQEILRVFYRYLESAIRDAMSEGAIAATDPAIAAKDLFALVEGTLAQARIHNDPQIVKSLPCSAKKWWRSTVTAAGTGAPPALAETVA